MHKLIIIIIILFSTIGQTRELTYNEFTLGNSFSPIDKSYLELEAKCRKSYDERDQKKYYEILLFSQGNHVFDFNKHFKSKLAGRKNLKTPFYFLYIEDLLCYKKRFLSLFLSYYGEETVFLFHCYLIF